MRGLKEYKSFEGKNDAFIKNLKKKDLPKLNSDVLIIEGVFSNQILSKHGHRIISMQEHAEIIKNEPIVEKFKKMI